jgi:hypothetical protein
LARQTGARAWSLTSALLTSLGAMFVAIFFPRVPSLVIAVAAVGVWILLALPAIWISAKHRRGHEEEWPVASQTTSKLGRRVRQLRPLMLIATLVLALIANHSPFVIGLALLIVVLLGLAALKQQ